MIDRESSCTTYEVIYRLKYGKRLRRAYLGDDERVYKEVIEELEKREDMRYISKSVTHTEVILFD